MSRVTLFLLAGTACSSRPPAGSLELVDPGAEPRAQVRYAGGKVDREIAFVSKLDKVPAETFADMRYRVRCDGERCRYQMVKFEVLGAGDDFESVRDAIHGAIRVPSNGPVVVEPDGMMTTVPSTPELLKAAIVSLPPEPIGVGARWVVVEGGLRQMVRLLSTDGRTLTVESSLETGSATMTLKQHGQLTVTLADPLAKGTLEVVQVMAADSTHDVGPHTAVQHVRIE